MFSPTSILWRVVLLTLLCGLTGKDPITFFGTVPYDFLDGLHGRPVQLHYRSDWHQWGTF